MAQVLRSPSAMFRDQVDRSLREYMTSMRRELGALPSRDRVVEIYRGECEAALGRTLGDGELTDTETAAIEAVEDRFRAESFIGRPSGLRRQGVKIHEDISVVESLHPVDGGTIRVTARLRQGWIEDVTLASDTTSGFHRPLAMEAMLRGVELRPEPLTRVVQSCHDHATHPADPPVGAWVQAILALDAHPKDRNHD
jgi:hypothetical protein